MRWSAWHVDPLVLLMLTAVGIAYVYGVTAMRLRARQSTAPPLRIAWFAAGIATLAIALLSPLDAIADALFSAHMVQHLLLIVVAAPLLVAARPVVPLFRALPRPIRRVAGRIARRPLVAATIRLLTAPAVAWATHSVTLWYWHIPGPYEAALQSAPIHAIEHLTFLITALLFWTPVLAPTRHARLSQPAIIFYTFTMMMQGAFLGAALTFTTVAWYPVHAAGAHAWGLTLLEDQQLAGLIMWVPAGLVYVGAMAWVVVRWLRAPVPHIAAGARWGALVCLFFLSACTNSKERESEPGQHAERAAYAEANADTSMASRANAEPEDGQWIRPAKDFASTRYSGLTAITTKNVGTLTVAGTFSTGVLRGHEAPPLVVGSTMYIVTPFPNYLYALDLTRPGFPIKWTYKPSPEPASQGVACCDVVNRGVTYANGKLFYNTLDAHTVAVDATTGKELWNVRVGNYQLGETMTMAPMAARGNVIVGNSGGEEGARGWIVALDQNTGKVVWKAYHTGPDRDILIDSRFHPFYAQDQGANLGVTTWPGETWKVGGGAAWGWISYDPALNLIYYGSSNPGPWNPAQRPGDNKWTSTLFARDADDGHAVWAYQISPHDLHDYDAVNENLLLDLTIDGQRRKVLVHPDRNGYVYVMDRVTGEVLSAKPFVYINSSTGVDIKTGALNYNPEKQPQVGTVVRNICPAEPGAKDWPPSAFSPQTGWLYIPHNNLCMDVEAHDVSYIAGTPYLGMTTKMYPGPGGNAGAFSAWDPVQGKEIWHINERFPVWSGALATAGGVVFYGTLDGWFKAVDARTGKLLWRYQTGSGIVGQPMAYRGPDGKEYVAILSGIGGWPGSLVTMSLDPRDSSAANGFVNAVKGLVNVSNKGGMLFVFGLP
jgi:PQQ-dependent dehydrogenase (methanol/ethanol family)